MRDTAIGAEVGATAGAATAGALAAGGFASRRGHAAMLKDALNSGYAVVIVHLSSEEALERTKRLLEEAAVEALVDD